MPLKRPAKAGNRRFSGETPVKAQRLALARKGHHDLPGLPGFLGLIAVLHSIRSYFQKSTFNVP
jgi:hypothetical protein